MSTAFSSVTDLTIANQREARLASAFFPGSLFPELLRLGLKPT